MRILVDMDAVIAHWGAEFDRCLDAFKDEAANIPRTKDQPDWDLNLNRTPREKVIIKAIMQEAGFYQRLEPIRGAKTALKNAVKAGHDVRIVSAPYVSNPTCASDKLNWIVRHYGSHWASRLVLTNDKTIVHGDYLIDDKPTITGSMDPKWTHVVFGEYSYNRNSPAELRIPAWEADTLLTLASLEKVPA